MSAGYTVSRPTLADAAAVAELAAATFVETYAGANDPARFAEHVERTFTADALATQLSDSRSEFHWVLQDGGPVAYLRVNTAGAQTEPGYEDGLEIQQVYVLAAHQGAGLGRVLLDLAGSVARERGLAYVWLGVWEDNPKAIAFYEHAGFEAFGEHRFVLGDEPQRDLLMRRWLARPGGGQVQ
ncbi:MAG TPA: N-acetyltransferase [Actinomycetes bacterium]